MVLLYSKVNGHRLVYLSVASDGLKKAFSIPLGGEPTHAKVTRQDSRAHGWTTGP